MSSHLIIQGSVPAPKLAELATLSHARPAQPLQTNAWCLPHANPDSQPEVASWCAAHQLDYAFIPSQRKPSDFGLIAMDMDSTLIAVECIDEVGDMLGIKPQIAAITQASMRGDMEFAESLTRRVALLAGLDIHFLEQVYQERVQLNPGAETLIERARALGIKTLLVSGGFTFFTDRLHERLTLDYSAANPLEIIGGKLTGRVLGKVLDAQGKADWLLNICQQNQLSPQQAVAIGDGANDLRMMEEAGVSIAFHAKPVVQRSASYAINHNGLDAVLPLLGDIPEIL